MKDELRKKCAYTVLTIFRYLYCKNLIFAPKNILTTLYLKPSYLVTAAIGLH